MITSLLMIKQLGIILGPVFILAFLGSVPSRCISPPDEFGFCLFEINPYNSVAYFQMILAAIAILMTVAFITYVPQYDISKAKPTDMLVTSVATEKKLLRQVKPVGLINATTVTCCACTMALYSIQSTLEVVLTPITDRYLGFN